MTEKENNVEKMFKYIEQNPDSEISQKIRAKVYENFKEGSLKLNEALTNPITPDEINFLNAVIKEDTEKTMLSWDVKDVLDKINSGEMFKGTGVTAGSNYELCLYLEALVRFTKNEKLKAFVKSLKEAHLND